MSQKNLIQAFILLVINLSCLRLSAQTYTLGTSPAINNATINTCSGTFVDSGGSGAAYGSNQNTTVTFCSNNGDEMVMNFSSFSLEGGSCQNDYMRIYDGNSTAAPLIGTFCGTNSPGIITGTGTCLTVQFVSNGSTTSTGWAAALSCYQCIDNSTCATQYIDLDFSDATVTKTLDPTGWVGDEWRFDNVYANTYALVKIVATQNTVATAVSNIDNPTQPNAQTWSPELGFNVIANQDSYIDWTITFYDNTTNLIKPLPKASRVTSYDIDGPTSRNPFTEMHGHTNPNGYILGAGSQLSVVSEPPRTIALGTPREFDGISNNDTSKVTFYYSDSISVFNIRLGIRASANGTAVSARQYALGFIACPNFNNPIVNPNIPTISGAGSICTNGTLTQTYTLASTYSNIVWTASGGTIVSGQGTESVTVTWPNTVGNYKISVVTTDGSSCVVNTAKSVTIHPLPTASATGSTVCVGQTINLTASGGTSYSWTGPASFSSNVQNPSIPSATLAMAGTYTVVVTDVNGCSSSTTASVTVNPAPSITLSASSSAICRGTTSATFAYTATGGSPTTYSIDFNAAANTAGLVDVVNAAFPSSPITVTVPAGIAVGTYTGTLTLNNASCASLTGTTITIVVDNPATVNAGSDLTICTNASPSAIILTGSTVGGSATTGAWSILSGGGSLSSTAQSGTPATVTYTPPAYIPANGNYSIDVTLQLLTNDPTGPCPAVSDTRIISVNYLVGGTLNGDQTICIDGDPSVIGN